jgi:hypothetical protein
MVRGLRRFGKTGTANRMPTESLHGNPLWHFLKIFQSLPLPLFARRKINQTLPVATISGPISIKWQDLAIPLK